MTLEDILLAVRRRFWLVVAGALVAGAVALILSLMWPPVYSAEAPLLITKLRSEVTLDPRFETLSEESIVNLSVQDDQVRRQTLLGLTRTPDLMAQLLDRLGGVLASDEGSLSFLQGATDVRTEGNLIILEAKADSPTKAAAIANAWAEVYEARVNLLYSSTSPGYDDIEEQVAAAGARYEEASKALEEFERTGRERELGRQIDQKLAILSGLETEHLATAREQVGSLLGRRNVIHRVATSVQSLRDHLASVPASAELSPGEQFALFSLEASTFTWDVPFTMTLELTTDWLLDTRATAGQAVEKLEGLQETLASARETLDTEVSERSLALLEGTELLAYEPEEAGLAQIAGLQTQINNLRAELQAEWRAKEELSDEKDLQREKYLALSRKATEVQILSQVTGVEVQIAAAAMEPENPSFPRPLFATVLAVGAGGLAGLALAFLLETRAALEDRR